MRILITDGNERVTLAAARSLVAAGHEVFVTAPMRWSLAGVSRGVRSHALQSDALSDPRGYVAELRTLTRDEGIDTLLPTTDPSVEAVLEYRAMLPEQLHVPLPSLAAYRAASDKARMLELARNCGLAGPETRVLEGPGAQSRELSDLFPAVIKPHRSVVTVQGRRRKLAVVPVANAAACDTALAALPREAYPVLVQREVTGAGEGLFALRWNGRVVAMIECKRDAHTGKHVLMEVNARLWGSLQLAIDAGVDFPALLARCVQGEEVPLCHVYRTDVRSRWFWGDVDNLLLRLRDRAWRR